MKRVRTLVQEVPAFALAWKEYLSLTKDAKQQKAIIENGLACDPDADTKGLFLVQEALLTYQNQKNAESAETAKVLLDFSFSVSQNCVIFSLSLCMCVCV